MLRIISLISLLVMGSIFMITSILYFINQQYMIGSISLSFVCLIGVLINFIKINHRKHKDDLIEDDRNVLFHIEFRSPHLSQHIMSSNKPNPFSSSSKNSSDSSLSYQTSSQLNNVYVIPSNFSIEKPPSYQLK